MHSIIRAPECVGVVALLTLGAKRAAMDVVLEMAGDTFGRLPDPRARGLAVTGLAGQSGVGAGEA